MKLKIWTAAAALLLATAIAAGIFIRRYAIVDLQLYPKDVPVLDLRGQEISLSHYDKLTEALPGTSIRWNIPFQGSFLADDTQSLTVSSLTSEEARLLADYLPQLKTVDGRECTRYDGLLALKLLQPELQVDYWVTIGSTNFASTAVQLNLPEIAAEDIPLLRYLPYLKSVTVSGGQPDSLLQLQSYCQERGLSLRLWLRSAPMDMEARQLEITGIAGEEIGLLYLLPELKTLHLTEPLADANLLMQLREDLPHVRITWEKTILGLPFSQDAKEIDLTSIVSVPEILWAGQPTPYQRCLAYGIQGDPEEVPSAVKLNDFYTLPDKSANTLALIEEAEAAMPYFPEAEALILCGCYLDNEAMAAFRARNEEAYKVVWTVNCGKIAVRTDATFFMPIKYHVYYLQDPGAYNLRYCPDMIAVDIGHMNVSDVSFVEFMPNLEYLILAHTSVRNIEPLRSCKKLKFLELDHTGVLDFSPLQDCTALEDLNIGMTWNEVEPLKEVKWLKNLWMVYRGKYAAEMIEALPNTNIVFAGSATVDSGWRDLPNYFAMRDHLKMFYMTW